MGILDRLLMPGGTSSRPVFEADLCLNRKQNVFSCDLCVGLCPEKILTGNLKDEMKWYRCSDCGLCVSSCPSRCFTPSVRMQRTLTEDLRPGETIMFSCDKETGAEGRKVACLAGIPWECLAALTFYGNVVLYTRKCKECEKETQRSCLQEHLDEIKAFLGGTRFGERVRLIDTDFDFADIEAAAAQRELSRRDILSRSRRSLKKGLYHAAADSLPRLEATEKDALQYRRLLSNAVLKERESVKKIRDDAQPGESVKKTRDDAQPGSTEAVPFPEYGVSLPEITTSCFGCGICERVCPQEAIEISSEKDGARLIYITPWKCTACGLCFRVCPHGGMNGLTKTAVPYLEKLPLVRVKTASCEKCGRAIQPGRSQKLCPVCASKAKRLRR